MINQNVKATPWDKKIFGFDTFEVLDYTEETLSQTKGAGHYTLKLDPLHDKALAEKYGFYYCDTLLVPECTPEHLKEFHMDQLTFDLNADIQQLLNICDGAFSHGRFHRDFKLDKKNADARYNQWLTDIHKKGHIFALKFNAQLAGFIAVQENELQLHAIAKDFRGKGYAKYWWSEVCQYLFLNGNSVITSSVSASNLAVLNLYTSLGFKFTKAVDVYHKLAN